MTKIKKYLQSIGLELNYEKYYTGRHIGGRSFYNDGTYGVEVFRIGDTNYSIHHKDTGRPAFYLYKNKNIVTLRFSQAAFLEVLKAVDFNV